MDTQQKRQGLPKQPRDAACRSSTRKLKDPTRAETAGPGFKSRLLSAPVSQVKLFIVSFNWKVLATMQEPVNFPQNVQTPEGKHFCPMLSCSAAGKAANNRPFPTPVNRGILVLRWNLWRSQIWVRSLTTLEVKHTVLDPKHQGRQKIPLGCLISRQKRKFEIQQLGKKISGLETLQGKL